MMIVYDDRDEVLEDHEMADDGRGSSVRIPSLFIRYSDGKEILEAVHNKEKVIVKAEIDLASKMDEPIEVDLWYSSAYEMLNHAWNFQDLAKMGSVFGKSVIFQPRIITYTCEVKDCSQK